MGEWQGVWGGGTALRTGPVSLIEAHCARSATGPSIAVRTLLKPPGGVSGNGEQAPGVTSMSPGTRRIGAAVHRHEALTSRGCHTIMGGPNLGGGNGSSRSLGETFLSGAVGSRLQPAWVPPDHGDRAGFLRPTRATSGGQLIREANVLTTGL